MKLTTSLVFTLGVASTYASTSIKVTNEYKKELNIKVQGTGVGGCDVVLGTNATDDGDCWCLWGTLNYSFCAYEKMSAEEIANGTVSKQNEEIVGNGKCPVITGESLVCSDLSSLGNCYDGSYSCSVDTSGLCHCEG